MLPIVDDVMWIALTVWQEARGEIDLGKLAVAHVICTRAREQNRSIPDTVFQSWQFSAWNTDSRTRLTLDQIRPDDAVWRACYKAAAGAYFELSADPSRGATHYLNERVVRRITGKLPSWYKADQVTCRIGEHTFLRLA